MLSVLVVALWLRVVLLLLLILVGVALRGALMVLLMGFLVIGFRLLVIDLGILLLMVIDLSGGLLLISLLLMVLLLHLRLMLAGMGGRLEVADLLLGLFELGAEALVGIDKVFVGLSEALDFVLQRSR